MTSFSIRRVQKNATPTPRKDLNKMVSAHDNCRRVWMLGLDFPELGAELEPPLRNLYGKFTESITKAVIHPRSLRLFTKEMRPRTWTIPPATTTVWYFTGAGMNLMAQSPGEVSLHPFDIVSFKTNHQALLGEMITLLEWPATLNTSTGQCSFVHTPAYTKTTKWILERFTDRIDSSLMDFQVPKIGYCSPKLLFVDTSEDAFPTDAKKWLNMGLGFVPARKPFTIGDIENQL